jgi:hypothetical protein
MLRMPLNSRPGTANANARQFCAGTVKSLRGMRGRSPRLQAGEHCHAYRVIRTIEDRAGLWTWRDRVRREFKPVEWRRSAGAVLKGLDMTEDASNAAEPQLRRHA